MVNENIIESENISENDKFNNPNLLNTNEFEKFWRRTEEQMKIEEQNLDILPYILGKT